MLLVWRHTETTDPERIMIPINYGIIKPITLCCGCWLAHVRANLLQFNRFVMINSLQLHGLQHARPPCPSPIPGVYPNSCPIMEKAMATHSSTLAWKIPWMEESDRLQSMGSLRIGHDWATSLSLFTFMHWRRKWQPTPVFLPGESQGRGSLVGCCLWGHTESDMTEAT